MGKVRKGDRVRFNTWRLADGQTSAPPEPWTGTVETVPRAKGPVMVKRDADGYIQGVQQAEIQDQRTEE